MYAEYDDTDYSSNADIERRELAAELAQQAARYRRREAILRDRDHDPADAERHAEEFFGDTEEDV